MSAFTDVRRFRKSPPDADGWWLFREQSFSFDQRILILGGMVADDYEFAVFAGMEPDEITDENYWEGNDPMEMTDGTLTRGLWKFEKPVGAAKTTAG